MLTKLFYKRQKKKKKKEKEKRYYEILLDIYPYQIEFLR